MTKPWLEQAQHKPRKHRQGQWQNVSCFGDNQFKRCLAELAKRHHSEQGYIVREALEARFGDELAEIAASLFPSEYAETNINSVNGLKEPA